MTAQELIFTGPETVTTQPTTVDEPDRREVVVKARLSAISPGTERHVFSGSVPAEMAADLSLETLDGTLDYPTKYGYAVVGEVVETGAAVDRLCRGQRVFAFHPHQSRFCLSADAVVEIPASLSDEQAVLFPTVETATNLLLDGQPVLGERVVVFGAGPVGLCTTRLLAAYPLAKLTVVEPIEHRRALARSFGADSVVHPDSVTESVDDPDLIYELSGEPDALDDATAVVGYDGRIVVGSWYGTKAANLELGGSFHRDRVSIESSQVSTISPSLRGRWSTERRREVTRSQLERIDSDALFTDRLPLREAQTAYERLARSPETTVQILFTYDD